MCFWLCSDSSGTFLCLLARCEDISHHLAVTQSFGALKMAEEEFCVPGEVPVVAHSGNRRLRARESDGPGRCSGGLLIQWDTEAPGPSRYLTFDPTQQRFPKQTRGRKQEGVKVVVEDWKSSRLFYECRRSLARLGCRGRYTCQGSVADVS